MPQYGPENSPADNLTLLAENEYIGRLLVVGYDANADTAVMGYAITGRSNGSQNRRLIVEDNIVSTEIADPTKDVGDPELTIYDAMRRTGSLHIVSNGNQTDRVVRYLRSGRTFDEAMAATTYEPDASNTPRISAVINLEPKIGEPFTQLSVVRKAADSTNTVRSLYTDIDDFAEDGFGYAVHTYLHNGEPLPAFDEPPFTLPLEGNAREMAHLLWDNLNPDNRVAVATKTISPSGQVNFAIVNRHN